MRLIPAVWGKICGTTQRIRYGLSKDINLQEYL